MKSSQSSTPTRIKHPSGKLGEKGKRETESGGSTPIGSKTTTSHLARLTPKQINIKERKATDFFGRVLQVYNYFSCLYFFIFHYFLSCIFMFSFFSSTCFHFFRFPVSIPFLCLSYLNLLFFSCLSYIFLIFSFTLTFRILFYVGQ